MRRGRCDRETVKDGAQYRYLPSSSARHASSQAVLGAGDLLANAIKGTSSSGCTLSTATTYGGRKSCVVGAIYNLATGGRSRLGGDRRHEQALEECGGTHEDRRQLMCHCPTRGSPATIRHAPANERSGAKCVLTWSPYLSGRRRRTPPADRSPLFMNAKAKIPKAGCCRNQLCALFLHCVETGGGHLARSDRVCRS